MSDDRLPLQIAALIAAHPEKRPRIARVLRAALDVVEQAPPAAEPGRLAQAFGVASVARALDGFAAALSMAAEHAELLAERGRLVMTPPPDPTARPPDEPTSAS